MADRPNPAVVFISQSEIKIKTHIKTGLSDSEWINLTINEMKPDPVSLREMIQVGRQGFGLNGVELENFVRDFILQALLNGAQGVRGDKSARYGWRPVSLHFGEPHSFAESLVDDLRTSNLDPDESGIWFAFPSVFN